MKRAQVVPRQNSLVLPVIANPFSYERELSFLNKVQVAIMSVTLAPLRAIVMFLLLIVAWLIAQLVLAFRSKDDKEKPLSGWRAALCPVLVLLGRVLFMILGFCVCKHRDSARKASASEAPVLVCAPHSTLMDVFLVFYGPLQLPSPVSRVENSSVPLLGKLLDCAQPVLVKRDDPNSRAHTMQEIKKRANSGGLWPQVIIFPEGTCTNRSCLISFKQGAFIPGVPVQPVCVRYPNHLDTVTWTWEGPGAFVQIWLTLCQLYTKVEIQYLPTYTPSEEEKKHPKLYAYNVRAAMAKCLEIPVTDHTFDDCRLMVQSMKLNMPPTIAIVEFEKLHSKIGVNYDQMSHLLTKFTEIKGTRWDECAEITYDDFSDYLLLPKSDALKQVFDLYDRDGSGTIDFREYVIGLSLVSRPANTDETLQLAFQLFDRDEDGYISLDELQNMLSTTFQMSADDVETMFNDVDASNDGRISFDEFKMYAEKKPEYAKVFMAYRQVSADKDEEETSNGSEEDSTAYKWNHSTAKPQTSLKKVQC